MSWFEVAWSIVGFAIIAVVARNVLKSGLPADTSTAIDLEGPTIDTSPD